MMLSEWPHTSYGCHWIRSTAGSTLCDESRGHTAEKSVCGGDSKAKDKGYIAPDIGAHKEQQAGYGQNRGENGEHWGGGCREVRPENERKI